MEYRKLPGTDIELSTIGIGGSRLHEFTQQQCNALMDYALDQGVNFIDLAIAYPEPLDLLGKAMVGRRNKAYYQIQLGMAFPGGQYALTRNPKEVQESFELQLRKLGTDYADFGFIHYVDDAENFEAVFDRGTMEYARKLKQQGTIRYLGFATHNVEIANRFIDTGEFNMGMFSINAAYDADPVGNIPFDEYDVTGQERFATAKEREKMYLECVKRGIGLSVMKAYGGGILLNEKTSPFGKAMTIHQCLQYALDRPGVLSCLIGVSGLDEMKEAMAYYETSPEERDYSFIAKLQHENMRGTCVYCNHCLPCPAGIEIAAVHKYLDLYSAGDHLAKEHYMSLAKNASDCALCGQCETRCPFGVGIREKMKQAKEIIKNEGETE
jgi:predicted aldo/keto reductase-like oxidoreductase